MCHQLSRRIQSRAATPSWPQRRPRALPGIRRQIEPVTSTQHRAVELIEVAQVHVLVRVDDAGELARIRHIEPIVGERR